MHVLRRKSGRCVVVITLANWFDSKLGMTFKRQRRTNTDMPPNTDMPAPSNAAMPMFLTSYETECIFGNMAESESLCVRVATLLRNKYASTLRVMP